MKMQIRIIYLIKYEIIQALIFFVYYIGVI